MRSIFGRSSVRPSGSAYPDRWGPLSSGFAIPGIVDIFSADTLILVLVGVVSVSAAFLLLLKPLPNKPGRADRKRHRSPLRYPLFRYIALGIGMLLFTDVLADYVIKKELGAAFDKAGIAAFMGPFYGISSAVTLAVQFGLTDRLLKKFGVTGPLAAVPILCVAGAIGVGLLPGLWSGAALRFIEGVGYYGLYSVGKEIADTPLPTAIRRTAKLFLRGSSPPSVPASPRCFFGSLPMRWG